MSARHRCTAGHAGGSLGSRRSAGPGGARWRPRDGDAEPADLEALMTSRLMTARPIASRPIARAPSAVAPTASALVAVGPGEPIPVSRPPSPARDSREPAVRTPPELQSMRSSPLFGDGKHPAGLPDVQREPQASSDRKTSATGRRSADAGGNGGEPRYHEHRARDHGEQLPERRARRRIADRGEQRDASGNAENGAGQCGKHLSRREPRAHLPRRRAERACNRRGAAGVESRRPRDEDHVDRCEGDERDRDHQQNLVQAIDPGAVQR